MHTCGPACARAAHRAKLPAQQPSLPLFFLSSRWQVGPGRQAFPLPLAAGRPRLHEWLIGRYPRQLPSPSFKLPINPQ
jgi:hypothetical protein